MVQYYQVLEVKDNISQFDFSYRTLSRWAAGIQSQRILHCILESVNLNQVSQRRPLMVFKFIYFVVLEIFKNTF